MRPGLFGSGSGLGSGLGSGTGTIFLPCGITGVGGSTGSKLDCVLGCGLGLGVVLRCGCDGVRVGGALGAGCTSGPGSGCGITGCGITGCGSSSGSG